MLCRLIRLARGVQDVLSRAAGAVTDWLGQRLRRAGTGTAHLDMVESNVGYAAAIAAVLGGLLGLVPARDVLAAILAAVLGAFLRRAGASSTTNRWTDPWGVD
jgi:hypothetical protein